ncbi:hypothetical protein [Rhodococcus qingshengii]|nr:hypothetical protein AWH04_08990 [Rhodococcus erythropolis]
MTPTPKVARLSYPMMPIPTGFIDAETTAGVASEVETVLLPWYVIETVAGVLSSTDVVTEVTIVAKTVAGVGSDGIFIRDNVIAETLAGVLSATLIIPVGIIAAATTAGVTSEAIPVPSAIGGGETYAEAISMVEVTPVVVALASSSAGITSEAAMIPVAAVVAETMAGAVSEGVITFGPTVSAYTSGSGKDNWAITLPPASTGDVRIIVVGLVAKSTNSISGWTKLGEDSSWYDPGVAVHYRVRRALDPETVTLNAGGYGSASTVVAMTIPGAMSPTIFGTTKNYSSTAPSPHTTPAITTTKVNSLAIRTVVGNPPSPSAPTYSAWGSPMTELAQVQSVPADNAGDNSVMTVATGSASVVGVQPAVNVVPSISMPYMGAAFAIEPMTVIAEMHLTTQHNLVSSGTQTQIVGWSADPDSTVTSDQLVIPVTKTGANVEVFLRYQTNSAVGTPSLQWRLLKNGTATQLASQTVSGGGVGANYEVVMTYTGNFVAGDYLHLTCAGTFTAPAPYVIPGVDTFVRVT